MKGRERGGAGSGSKKGPNRPGRSASEEPADLGTLAGRYIDLWQAQLAGLMGDAGLAEQMLRLIGGTASAFAAAAEAARRSPAGAAGGATEHRASGTGEPDRSAPAHPPSRNGDDELDRLRRRVADLEERLARLEAGTRRHGDSAQKGSRRRRS